MSTVVILRKQRKAESNAISELSEYMKKAFSWQIPLDRSPHMMWKHFFLAWSLLKNTWIIIFWGSCSEYIFTKISAKNVCIYYAHTQYAWNQAQHKVISQWIWLLKLTLDQTVVGVLRKLAFLLTELLNKLIVLFTEWNDFWVI